MKMFVVIILLCASPLPTLLSTSCKLHFTKKPSKQPLITELLRSEKVNKALKHLNKCGAAIVGT